MRGLVRGVRDIPLMSALEVFRDRFVSRHVAMANLKLHTTRAQVKVSANQPGMANLPLVMKALLLLLLKLLSCFLFAFLPHISILSEGQPCMFQMALQVV